MKKRRFYTGTKAKEEKKRHGFHIGKIKKPGRAGDKKDTWGLWGKKGKGALTRREPTKHQNNTWQEKERQRGHLSTLKGKNFLHCGAECNGEMRGAGWRR